MSLGISGGLNVRGLDAGSGLNPTAKTQDETIRIFRPDVSTSARAAGRTPAVVPTVDHGIEPQPDN